MTDPAPIQIKRCNRCGDSRDVAHVSYGAASRYICRDVRACNERAERQLQCGKRPEDARCD